MSITNQSEHIRTQCRQLVIKHVLNYGLLKGKKPRQLFEYYCAQLNYEYEDGRISALESLNSIFDFVDQVSRSYTVCLAALMLWEMALFLFRSL